MFLIQASKLIVTALTLMSLMTLVYTFLITASVTKELLRKFTDLLNAP
jgi:hypothetical protein